MLTTRADPASREHQFSYIARDPAGRQVEGTIRASSVQEASGRLREQSLFPVRLERAWTFSLPNVAINRRVRPSVLAQFYSQTADLLRAGVPLLRALEILGRRSSKARLTEVLTDVHRRVADGQTIASAMAAHQDQFGELTVSMVRAGQEGGFLEDVFERIAIFTERQEDLRLRVVSTMAYPIVLLGIGSTVVGVLLVFFVPQFGPIFDRLRERGEMPAATEALLAASRALRSYGIILVAAAAGLGFLLRRKARSPEGKRFLDAQKLRLPIAGSIFRDLAITRFERVLGTLCRNGVPILAALRISKDSLGNLPMQEAIDRAADNVKAGDRLATPLRASGCFPDDIVEMIEVAQESNTLDRVLLESADRLEARTTRQLDIAVRLLEPLLLLLMAGIVLLVVLALLLPIFRMSSAIG